MKEKNFPERSVIEHNNNIYNRTGTGGHGTPDGPLCYVIYARSRNRRNTDFIYLTHETDVLLRQYNMRFETEVHVEGIELLYY